MNRLLKVFFFTTITFGTFMTAFTYVIGNGDISIGAIAGLSFGVAMTITLGIIDKLANKSSGAARNAGVKQHETIVIPLPIEQAFELCLQSALSINGTVIKEQDSKHRTIQAKTRKSWKSYGEKISFSLESINDHSTKATIQSKPSVSTTLIDYGKNYENVKKIINFIETSKIA